MCVCVCVCVLNPKQDNVDMRRIERTRYAYRLHSNKEKIPQICEGPSENGGPVARFNKRENTFSFFRTHSNIPGMCEGRSENGTYTDHILIKKQYRRYAKDGAKTVVL